MPVDIVVPSFGESISEGTLARWIKRDGDLVQRDEPVAELESEKATTEVRAAAAGKLKTTVAEGDAVPVGSVIGSIDDSVKVPSAAAPSSARGTSESSPPHMKGGQERFRETVASAGTLSPSARVHAESKGIDPHQLTGSGRGGRIIKEDVLTGFHDTNGASPPAAPSQGGEKTATSAWRGEQREVRQRMSAMRQRIAARLLESKQSTAALTTFNEADMSAIIAMRSLHKDAFKEQFGVNLGFMSFFIKATIEALRAFPVVNARIDGSDIVYQNYYNIGVAVSTERGLVVPVLRDADRMSFADIERAIADVANKARDGRLAVSDVQGGTFTITNGGIFGSLMSTPILNPPQTGILGMHSIQKRPVAIDDQVEIRPMMYSAMTYDHRIIDGREAVQFLVRIKECVEHPERILLGV